MRQVWRLRRKFWNRLLTFKFRMAKPLVIPIPRGLDRSIGYVPLSEAFARIPISNIFVADYVPRDERQPLALWFCRLQAWLNRVISPMQSGLPPIDRDPNRALKTAYTLRHRRCYPAPARPRQYTAPLDLGEIAVASPYACYLQSDSQGVLQWDVRGLEVFECHPGLRSPWALVEFKVVSATGHLRATRIESELGVSSPGDATWAEAQRLALCAVATHLSLVRHFNWIHLVSGAPLAIVTRNCLPVDHPVRRLLQPHVFATQSSNQMVTLVQMERGGDFEKVFSFTHDGMCKLFDATCDDFALRSVEPSLDTNRRGVDRTGLIMPALENRIDLMRVIRAHVSRYLGLYYDSDHALVQDQAFGAWLTDLDKRIPRGAGDMAGSPPTINGATLLLSTLIYLTTVEHEIVGSGIWDYQLWSDVQPARVYTDGQRPPLDAYQRLVNANFNLNVPRTPLMSNFASLALDGRGEAAFRQFRLDLASLQRVLDRVPAPPWRIDPRRLKANINA